MDQEEKSTNETTIMTVWPSLASTGGGRFWGRLYAIKTLQGVLPFGLTLGHLIAALSIPLILPPFFLMLLPFSCRRYRLTNQRVVVDKGLMGNVERFVSLDRFDSIEIEVLDGQQWYSAGEMIFSNGGVETFRLQGVPRPEAFRQTCLKANKSFVGIQQARKIGAAV